MEQASMTSAYMWSFVVMAAFFLLAVLIANMILFKPGNTGVTQRRVWFWILAIGTGIISFLINYGIGSGITVPNIHWQLFYAFRNSIRCISCNFYRSWICIE